MTTKDPELAALKRELHSNIRTKVAAMSGNERARYIENLNPKQRKLLKTIVTGVEAREAASSGASYLTESAHAMDLKMGLLASTPRVVRTPNQLVAGVVDTPKPQPAASRPQPSAAGTRPGGALNRSTVARPTRQSDAADELDRRMGFGGGGPTVTRTRTSLTFNTPPSAATRE